MGQVHSPDARITAGVNIKLLEVTGLPHFNNAVVTSCYQILSVTAQQDGLRGKKMDKYRECVLLNGRVVVCVSYTCGVVDFHLCQKFSINAEVTELPSFIVDDTVALAGHRDQTGAETVLGTLEGPQ